MRPPPPASIGRGQGRGMGPMAGMMKGDKPANFSAAMGKLFRYMGRYKIAFAFAIVFSAFSTAGFIFGPKILGNVTTALFNGIIATIDNTGNIDFVYIGTTLVEVLLLYVGSALCGLFSGWIMATVSTDTTYRLRKDIAEKINHLPLKYYDNTTYGEVLSRITNDVDTINNSLSQSITSIISSVTQIVGVTYMMLTINLYMTGITFLMLPITFILMAIILGRSQKYFKQQQDYLGHVNGHVEEMYGGHIVMRAFNGEEKSIAKFDESNKKWYNGSWKANFYSGLMIPISMFIGNLGYVAIAILGGYLAAIGTIQVGDIQAFIQYVRSFTQPIQQIAQISNVLQQTAAASERVFKFLEEEEETPDPENPIILSTVEGRVEFQHVHFGYNLDKVIINDFSAIAEPGHKIAIVGPTGAGKTTIVKLLMRFYDLNGGAILVDGHDTREFTRNELRKMFGMVLQDTWLYNASLMENIRYGRQDATDEEVISAAKTAYADHFIRTLPEGYNMEINEEASNVSQGQMQLLTIARAILANPPMLILDEATSSVDTHTEVLIQQAMDELMKNRTTFVIAHRLSTIKNADLILVMRDGDIVEQGTHDELLAQGGFYAELHNSQFGLVPEENGGVMHT
ncbi:MAG TPA: ABC transporter ATP-binding protein [Candidatus Lokiarchaeia archaeon]|nr:ABC transporter ATP-binding protein [Candidatus Lokiarchaeia archaeon]